MTKGEIMTMASQSRNLKRLVSRNGRAASATTGSLPASFTLEKMERLELDAMRNKRSNLDLQMEIAHRNYQAALQEVSAKQTEWARDVANRLGIDVASLSSLYELNAETGEAKLVKNHGTPSVSPPPAPAGDPAPAPT